MKQQMFPSKCLVVQNFCKSKETQNPPFFKLNSCGQQLYKYTKGKRAHMCVCIEIHTHGAALAVNGGGYQGPSL